ncbi:MAG: hypothetical protein SPI15_01575, partial [Candidatus Faecousia sp.]|nr:hypothetical protein [Candidatus Faecousia sp.]
NTNLSLCFHTESLNRDFLRIRRSGNKLPTQCRPKGAAERTDYAQTARDFGSDQGLEPQESFMDFKVTNRRAGAKDPLFWA